MKQFIVFLLALTTTATSLATVDVHDKVYIVVQNIQDEAEFFVERVPVIGCIGLPQGARLIQFTMEYKVTSNIGCGGEVFYDNINALTCAKVTKSKESNDYMGFSEITLDISKCDYKSNPKFITMLRTAAKLNFPQQKGEVKLNLVK